MTIKDALHDIAAGLDRSAWHTDKTPQCPVCFKQDNRYDGTDISKGGEWRWCENCEQNFKRFVVDDEADEAEFQHECAWHQVDCDEGFDNER